MTTMQDRLQAMAGRAADQDKALKVLINGNAADLSALMTTAKGNLVAALNEVLGLVEAVDPGAVIDDGATAGDDVTWSVEKIRDQLILLKDEILGGAGPAFDTLKELADQLADNDDALAAITAALGSRVRTDTAAQGLTTEQKANARANIAAYGPVELGDPTTDLVAIFEARLT